MPVNGSFNSAVCLGQRLSTTDHYSPACWRDSRHPRLLLLRRRRRPDRRRRLQVAARDLSGFGVDVAPSRWTRYSDFTPDGLAGPAAGAPGPYLPGLLPGAYVARPGGGPQTDALGPAGNRTWTLSSLSFGVRPVAADIGSATSTCSPARQRAADSSGYRGISAARGGIVGVSLLCVRVCGAAPPLRDVRVGRPGLWWRLPRSDCGHFKVSGSRQVRLDAHPLPTVRPEWRLNESLATR